MTKEYSEAFDKLFGKGNKGQVKRTFCPVCERKSVVLKKNGTYYCLFCLATVEYD